MINSAAAPFDDIRARKALALATPSQTYLDLIALGVIRGADQRFIPEDPYHNPDVKMVGDDPDTARASLPSTAASSRRPAPTARSTSSCSSGRLRVLDPTRRDPDRGLERGVQRHPTTARGRAHPADRARSVQRQSVAPVRGRGPAADNVWLLCRTIGGISLNWPRFCDEERDAALLRPRPPPIRPSGRPLPAGRADDQRGLPLHLPHPHGLDERLHRERARRVRPHVARGSAAQCAVAAVRGSARSGWTDDPTATQPPEQNELLGCNGLSAICSCCWSAC